MLEATPRVYEGGGQGISETTERSSTEAACGYRGVCWGAVKAEPKPPSPPAAVGSEAYLPGSDGPPFPRA
jgi:hypothetical protein